MKNVIVVLVFLLSVSLFSQQISNGLSVVSEKQRLDFTRGYEMNEKDILGKPYFDDIFLPANVEGYDDVYLLRYNAAKDEMEFEKDNRILYVTKADNLQITFMSSKKIYRLFDYESKKENLKGYFVLLKENENISLYKKEFIKLIPKRISSSPYTDDTPARYEFEKDTYYIKLDNTLKLFPKNKKELLKIYPKSEKIISDFVKSKNISFSKEYDLIVLTDFLNGL